VKIILLNDIESLHKGDMVDAEPLELDWVRVGSTYLPPFQFVVIPEDDNS
jgi:hypothetical protein